MEGGRAGGWEGGREGGREGWREGGRERGRDGWREGVLEVKFLECEVCLNDACCLDPRPEHVLFRWNVVWL